MPLTLNTEDCHITSYTQTFTGNRMGHWAVNFTDIQPNPTLNSRSGHEASSRQAVLSNWYTGPTVCVVE